MSLASKPPRPCFDIHIMPAGMLPGFRWSVFPAEFFCPSLASGRCETWEEAQAAAKAWIAHNGGQV